MHHFTAVRDSADFSNLRISQETAQSRIKEFLDSNPQINLVLFNAQTNGDVAIWNSKLRDAVTPLQLQEISRIFLQFIKELNREISFYGHFSGSAKKLTMKAFVKLLGYEDSELCAVVAPRLHEKLKSLQTDSIRKQEAQMYAGSLWDVCPGF